MDIEKLFSDLLKQIPIKKKIKKKEKRGLRKTYINSCS